MQARRAGALLPILMVIVTAVGCGQGTGDLGSVASPPPTEQPSLDVPSPEPTPEPSSGPTTPAPSGGPTPAPTSTETITLRAYFILGSFTDNPGLVPVLRQVPRTQAVGAAAMRELLEGPNDSELGARPAMYTTIPEGTRFLGLTIDSGVATVDLSREFESGGGSSSVLGRLAQVVYTLTQFPTVRAVKFKLDGQPVTVFSGEGVPLGEPVGRDDYTDLLPAIFVDRPAWGGAFGNPGRLAGLANVFEATFQFAVVDAAGRSHAGGTLTATCGTGCWGSFDATVPYTISSAGWGTLRVFELSAKDGSVVNLTEYPVWLTP